MYTVYKHTFPNDKVYIGITNQNVNKRWQCGWGYAQQPYIYHAIKKYGWDNIKHEILFTGLTKEEAEQKEIELIALYKSNDRMYGYNIASGGDHIGKHSEETKRKIKLSNIGKNKGNQTMLGKHHSEETRKKLSESHKGKPTWNKGLHLSDEHKRKLSESERGKIVTEETRRKMSETRSKKVMCIETGIVYCSVKEAQQKTHVDIANITRVCNGKRKTAGNYHWRYCDGI